MTPPRPTAFGVAPALAASSRFAAAGARVAGGRAAAASLLLLFGAGAGLASALLDFDLRTPGHAVLRSVVPMAAGLAFVPRRGGATLMALAAAATVASLGGGRDVAGPGALTSLVLLGPVLDLALRRARSGRGVFLAFMAAGLATNAAAFAVRLADKFAAPEVTRPVAAWWPRAAASYALCGLAAGAVAAAICFRWRDRAPAGRAA